MTARSLHRLLLHSQKRRRLVLEPWGMEIDAPDVAGWRREWMPELPVDEPIRVVPDWVCEILSPTTRRHDLLVKLPYYARVGVAYHWLVDLEARTATAHQLDGGAWRMIHVFGDETEARIEPFEAVSLDVASWWA